MKILQVNLGRGRAAHDLAFLTAGEQEAEIIVVAQPNKKIAGRDRLLADARLDVAVYLRNRRLEIKEHRSVEGYMHLSNLHW